MRFHSFVQWCTPLCALVGLWACQKSPSTTPGADNQPPLHATEKIAYVALHDTPLNLKPTADHEIVLQDRNNQVVINRIANINLGDQMIIVAPHGQWLEVITPKGATGFVQVADIAELKNSCERTSLDSVPAYNQPDDGQASDLIPAGTLLIAQECDKAWVRIHIPHIGWRYVHAEQLTADPAAIGMSRLINEAKIAVAANDPTEAAEALQEGRVKYPEHPLLDVLAEFVDFSMMQEHPVTPTGRQKYKPIKFQ